MIRQANFDDIPQICSLLKQVHGVHSEGRPDIFKKNAQKYNEEELKDILSDSNRPVYVFESDSGIVVGYVFCMYEKREETRSVYPSTSIYIDDLCVDENERGKGIGTKLYEFIAEKGRREHIDTITLNVWGFNESAHAFYEKCGMKPLKTIMEQKLGKNE